MNSLFRLHSGVSGSGVCLPLFSTLLSKPLVMAYLAPAVAACAHSRPPAQSLSCPIYLTQTRASQPCPAYLSAGWLSVGLNTDLRPLLSGNQNASRRGSVQVSHVSLHEPCLCAQETCTTCKQVFNLTLTKKSLRNEIKIKKHTCLLSY